MSTNATKTQSISDESGSVSAKIAKLEQLTDWFYGEQFSLDQALAQYETAIQLASEIKNDLAELRNQVEILHKDFTKD